MNMSLRKKSHVNVVKTSLRNAIIIDMKTPIVEQKNGHHFAASEAMKTKHALPAFAKEWISIQVYSYIRDEKIELV